MMKIKIEIPKEFEEHFKRDKFEDSLNRLYADVHLLAGNYERELAEMLIKAFKESKPVYDIDNAVEKSEAIGRLELLFSDSTSENYPFTDEFGEAVRIAIKALSNTSGYSKAENDYYVQSEKDRQSSYDCGHETGYREAINDFVNAANEICKTHGLGVDRNAKEFLYAHEDRTWHSLFDDVAKQLIDNCCKKEAPDLAEDERPLSRGRSR